MKNQSTLSARRELGLFITVLVLFAAFFIPPTSATAQPCATVTWTYNAGGADSHRANMQTDIEAGLNRLAAVTGLRFVRSSTPDADLRYGWEAFTSKGEAGAANLTGSIVFNSKDNWTLDENSGFALLDGYLPGRGWLVIHETMHALGVANHSDDPTQVMYPVAHATQFGTEDLATLHVLYPKKGC